MFIDYLTLIMINMVAGTAILAYYLWRGMDQPDQRPFAAAFAGVGLLALILGLQLIFPWPFPGRFLSRISGGSGKATSASAG